jgi:ADP-heptose:LPS heptosyltransferase
MSRAYSRPAVLALATARMAFDALTRRRRMPPRSPRRIVIAHHLLLGDTIMLTPLIAKCRARWPDADIAMTCPIPYVELYAARPYGVRAVPYDPRVVGTLGPLFAKSGFDLALVPADSRLSWLARALGAGWIVAFAGDSPRYKNWPVDELRDYPNRPTAWGDIVAGLIDGPPPDAYRVRDWPAPPAPDFIPPATRYCVLHAGASSPLKRWPAERWRELGTRLAAHDLDIVLSAGPGETELLDEIDPQRRWQRFPGTLSLGRLWQLVARAALVVCPDTGVAHLARLTGTPTVALFGPGSALLSGGGEFWRNSPFTALTVQDFPCRDQRITMKREVAWIRRCERLPGSGSGRCADARCMRALTGDDVYRAALARLPAPSALRH